MADKVVNFPRKGHGMPPHLRNIFEAAQADDVASVKAALEHLSVDTANEENGMTILHYAAGRASSGVVDLLIERGANPMVFDHFDRTAHTLLARALPGLKPELEQKLWDYTAAKMDLD